MKAYYMNHTGERINFLGDKIAIQDIETVFGNTWDYSAATSMIFGGKVKKFYKGLQEKSFTVSIVADTEKEFTAICKEIEDVIFYDVQKKVPGRLYINDTYLSCYIFESDYTDYEDLFYMTDKKFTLVTEYPNWIKEHQYTIDSTVTLTNFVAGLAVTGKAIAGDTGIPTEESDFIESRVENPQRMPCNFKLIIHGPVDSPYVEIGGNVYDINVDVPGESYLLIDSKERQTVICDKNGNTENVFAFRNPNYSIYEKIAPGINEVVYSGTQPLDFIIYEERGEPYWS